MNVWTSMNGYPGPHKLDISTDTKDPFGHHFKTTKYMEDLNKNNQLIAFKNEYHKMITDIINNKPDIWSALLKREKVVLTCTHNISQDCHKHFLAHYLRWAGATYIGEITPDKFSKWHAIDDFHRPSYMFLSNMFRINLTIDGTEYYSVEHFFQAQKTDDIKLKLKLATCPRPKQTGRNIKLVDDWESIKDKIMLQGVTEKFKDPYLKRRLLATGEKQIIEGNSWHDNYWGACFCRKCKDFHHHNKLGKILMKIRKDLQKEDK